MAEAVNDLPRYVDFGLRSVYPGPFRCRDGDMRMFVLDGDRERIGDLVERTLTTAAPGDVAYRPIGGRVMLLYGLNVVTSATAPYDGYGKVDEWLASFWVPVLRGRRHDGDFRAERLCMFVSHLLVDNPLSLVAGREIYGFPKALGCFSWTGDDLRIDGFGGEHRPEATAKWLPVLEMRRAAGGEGEAGGEAAEGMDGLVDTVMERLVEPGAEGVLPDLCRDLRRGRMTMVFLKQFRDAAQHDRACHQAVVEAVSVTHRVTTRPSLADWDVTIHPVDSHPLAGDLGVRSGRHGWSATLKGFDFDVLEGREVSA